MRTVGLLSDFLETGSALLNFLARNVAHSLLRQLETASKTRSSFGIDQFQSSIGQVRAPTPYISRQTCPARVDAVCIDVSIQQCEVVSVRALPHCEHNIALDDRPANTVKNGLIAVGVNADRINTISYGKERPFCTEHNGACLAAELSQPFRVSEVPRQGVAKACISNAS